MKLSVIVVFVVLACFANAQTKKPAKRYPISEPPRVYVAPNPGNKQLAIVKSQIDQVNRKIKDIQAKQYSANQKLNLQCRAKQISNKDEMRGIAANDKSAMQQIAPLETQRAALELKEFEIRERYKIPKKN